MGLYDYSNFLKEAVKEENLIPIVYSDRFKKTLERVAPSKLRDHLLMLPFGKPQDMSYIDMAEKDDSISFIPSLKAKTILDKFRSIKREQEGINFCWVNNRQEQKISRYINKMFPSQFTPKEVEDFVHDYKVAVKADKSFDLFEIIRGDDVAKFYGGSYYSREATGQLQRSCMRYSESGHIFELYTKNPDKMGMLILKEPDGKRIYGRANLWNLDDPEGRIYMDRIYTTYDWQIKLYIDYAIKNNYIYKSKQIYGGSVIPVINNGKSEKLIMTVKLKKGQDYKYFPYVDTLQFYNEKEHTLTSDVSKFNKKRWVALVLANGEAFDGENGRFGIDYLGRIVYEDYLFWSELDQVHVHRQDAVPLNYRNDYATPEHEFVKIGSEIFLKDDCEELEDGQYKLKKKI
jgi:hypothetical protein